MKIEFKNKIVLITGGTSGIGLALTKKLFDLGAIVYRTSTTQKSSIKNKNGNNFIKTFKVNFFSESETKKFLNEIKKVETIDIINFPSSLFHHTITFNNEEDRICFVFDLIPTN